MKFEKAREEFVRELTGHLVDGDIEINYPREKVLGFLSTVNDPMDPQALDVLRDELPEDEYPSPGPGALTWAQGVRFLREDAEKGLSVLREMHPDLFGLRTTPTAFIEELETEAARHFTCVLVVGFKNTSIMISAKQEDRLQLLNKSITQGGIPIGLITADKEAKGPEGGILKVTARIFPEHLENGPNEEAETFMLKLVAQLRDGLESGGFIAA
jgi:hypothetical protein